MTPSVVYRTVGLAAALVVAALVAQQLLTLLLVVLVVIIVALPLTAAASAAERRGLPRAFGALAALIAALAVLVGRAFAVLPAFVTQVKQFAQRLPAILTGADRYLHGLTGKSTRSLSSQLSGFIQGYVHHPARLAGPVEHIGLTAVEILFVLLLIIVAAFLIAINPTMLVKSCLRLLPPARRPAAEDAMTRVRVAWLGWMAAVGLDMLVLGGLLFVGLELVGLNFAIGFAVFSAFMTVIPNYGSVVSAIPPIVAALAQSPTKALLVLIVYLVVNQIEGNLILPLIMARTVDMHPGVVTLGLLVMAALFGLIGVLVAIPLLSLAVILVETLWIEPQEERADRQRPPSVTATSGAP
ncbi:MAG: AI-2E family transporter [Solirubrobacteraceae bacterium]